jgi:hypothetical protein
MFADPGEIESLFDDSKKVILRQMPIAGRVNCGKFLDWFRKYYVNPGKFIQLKDVVYSTVWKDGEALVVTNNFIGKFSVLMSIESFHAKIKSRLSWKRPPIGELMLVMYKLDKQSWDEYQFKRTYSESENVGEVSARISAQLIKYSDQVLTLGFFDSENSCFPWFKNSYELNELMNGLFDHEDGYDED